VVGITGSQRNPALLLLVVPDASSVNIKYQEAEQGKHDERDIDCEIDTELVWEKAWCI
jgi:hypothetical protein